MLLFTLGYEGFTVNAFVAVLRAAGVEAVCDARELPLSRKRGFSKNTLRKTLAKAGIEYDHVRPLGCPSAVRNQYKVDQDWNAYVIAFRKHLRSQRQSIAELARRARRRRTCIICYEENFERCHRSMVADAAAKLESLRVIHLNQTGKSAR
jgi:uncharacterized protein (DUF488 family)